MIEFDNTLTRRLPVYLLLDRSGSMTGVGIQGVNQGVQILLSELKQDPMSLETAYISCIAFSNRAEEILPLTEVGDATIPELHADGGTNMADALRMLLDKLEKEVRQNTNEQKGDWKPIVFLFSDGNPTENNWPRYANKLKEMANRQKLNIIALGCGLDIDTHILEQIGNIVLLMEDVTHEHIVSFFKWVSQSVKVASQRIEDLGATNESEKKVNLPPPPDGINIVL